MIRKFFPNQWAKEGIGPWLLNQGKSQTLFYLLIAFLPTQLGLHFWPNFSYVEGIRVDYLSPTIYFTDIIIGALFLTNLKSLFRFILKLKVSNVSFFLFVLFLIAIFIGIFYSKNQTAGLYGMVKLIEFSFLFLYVKHKIKILNIKFFFSALCIGLLFESFLAIAQYFNNGSIGGFFYFFGERTFNSQTPGIANASIDGKLILRPYATFSHPNVLAGYLLIASSLILIIKKFFHPILYISTVAIFLSFSRLAIILWIIYVFIFLFIKSDKKISIRLFSAFLLIAPCFLLVFIIPEIFLRFKELSFLDTTVVEREEFLSNSISMFKANPLFGVGLNNYFVNLPFFSVSKNIMSLQPVHNIFLLILSELGISGFLFFCLFLIKAFVRLAVKHDIYLMILLSTILILGLFDHYFLTLQQGQIIFSLILGLSYRSKLL